MEPIYMQLIAYAVVVLAVGVTAWTHWKNNWKYRPAKDYEPPYMVCGLDFTRFPRGSTHHESIVWVQEKFVAEGKAKPSISLAEECMVEYYTKYPSDVPSLPEQLAMAKKA